MAKLSFQERNIVEKFLEMDDGYVLNFTDRLFREFVGSNTNLDIADEKYSGNGGSKAKRLRSFIDLETDKVIGELFRAFHSYKLKEYPRLEKEFNAAEAEQFFKISERLYAGKVIDTIDAIQAINDDKDFHQLAKLIQESIEKNEPESALDRLHLFLIKFLKELCDGYGTEYSKEETVNALFGKYVKTVEAKNYIESDMAKRIIQFSFQVIQAFNDVRNNRSFAHDNPVLNYDEAILIFRNITATVKFIQAIETKNKNITAAEAETKWDFFK